MSSKKTKSAAKPKATKVAKPAKVKAEKPAKVERVVKNGVTQPGEGTMCRAVWDACDKLGKDVTFEALRELVDNNVADATIRTQRQRHKVFNS